MITPEEINIKNQAEVLAACYKVLTEVRRILEVEEGMPVTGRAREVMARLKELEGK